MTSTEESIGKNNLRDVSPYLTRMNKLNLVHSWKSEVEGRSKLYKLTTFGEKIARRLEERFGNPGPSVPGGFSGPVPDEKRGKIRQLINPDFVELQVK